MARIRVLLKFESAIRVSIRSYIKFIATISGKLFIVSLRIIR